MSEKEYIETNDPKFIPAFCNLTDIKRFDNIIIFTFGYAEPLDQTTRRIGVEFKLAMSINAAKGFHKDLGIRIGSPDMGISDEPKGRI